MPAKVQFSAIAGCLQAEVCASRVSATLPGDALRGKCIEEFKFRNLSSMSETDRSSILNAIEPMTTIRKLQVTTEKAEGTLDVAPTFVQAFTQRCFATLEELIIVASDYGTRSDPEQMSTDDSCQFLKAIDSCSTGLTNLALTGLCMSDGAAGSLGASIARLESLQVLSVHDDCLNSSNSSKLFAPLVVLKHLRKLSIGAAGKSSSMCPSACGPLKDLLASPSCRLKTLTIDLKACGTADWIPMWEGVAASRSIRRFECGSNMTAECAKAMGKAIEFAEGLEEVSLTRARRHVHADRSAAPRDKATISPWCTGLAAGLEARARGGRLGCIKKLTLKDVVLTTESQSLLGAAMKCTHGLRRLLLSGCVNERAEPVCPEQLLEALSEHDCGLRELHLIMIPLVSARNGDLLGMCLQR